MFPYMPNTPEDEKKMLDAIGVKSVDDLFSDIPEDLKLKESLKLGAPMSELEMSRRMAAIAGKNETADNMPCFLGAGAYDHYIPSIIKHMVSRSEFYTAYTPYQPEISQGTLQAIFEYQTMICNLTGMDVANASMYDGATATSEAMFMACEATRRSQVVMSTSVSPETRRVVKTYARFKGFEVVEVEMNEGATCAAALSKAVSKDTAAVIIQNPNFLGYIEEVEEIEKIAHDNKALLVMNVNPISLGVLKTPGEYGADIVVGEGQPLGSTMSFGGPYLGFMAVTSKLMRKMPGRIVGQTTDVDGKRAFVLTLQAREQHIRRQRATSNICSNEGLNALCSAIYMSTLGKQGIKEVAEQCARKAHHAFKKVTESGKFKPLYNRPFFMEFCVTSDSSAETVNAGLLKNGIIGGYDLSKEYPTLENAMMFCVTEKRSREEIDKLAEVMGGMMK